MNPGDEFRIQATPSQELLNKLSYLAAQGSGSVITDGFRSGPAAAALGRKGGTTESAAELLRYLDAQERAHQERMRLLEEEFDALDRASDRGLREARERLEEIRRTANRTRDGRPVFEDEDGTIRDEDGNETSRDEIDWDSWNDNADKWGDYRAARRGVDEAADFQRRVRAGRERLGDNPGDDDLADLGDELDALKAGMPASIVRAYEPPGISGTSSPAQAGAGPRSTSAAKSYLDGPAIGEGIGVRDLFAGAVRPADAGPGARPADAPLPGLSFPPS